MAVGDDAKSRLVAVILSAGEISRAQLSERTGLSPSRVTKVVAPLLESGVLEEVGAGVAQGGPGRPRRMLAVRRDRSVVVGVKLAPRRVTGVLTDMDSRVLRSGSRALDSSDPEVAIRAVGELCAEFRAEGAPVAGVGVGLGGHVDGGVCVWSGLLGWRDVEIADRLADEVGVPVVVDNDVNALAVAELWFGAGRGMRSFAVVTVGVGVGCGLVLGGEPHVGVAGLAGEIGHLPLFPDGPLCTCGNRGCLEAVASRDGMVRAVREQGVACRSFAHLVRMARDGDPAARRVFADTGTAVGRALAVLGNLLNLERIILSGEGMTEYDLFEPALETAWRGHSFSTARVDCDLVPVPVDQVRWATGAACLAIEHLVRSRAFVAPGLPDGG
ncbi:ROK family transcriptional regulator [Actinokineospora enzanensis]|uniref:ROK family transcriptional regulator n=1 Tax=Actinokineospora enzanensis TaxID=155975 RepID=UPI00035ED2D8|nr:ROK family transcriptional regulator [Actinokineospora enzanensis]